MLCIVSIFNHEQAKTNDSQTRVNSRCLLNGANSVLPIEKVEQGRQRYLLICHLEVKIVIYIQTPIVINYYVYYIK